MRSRPRASAMTRLVNVAIAAAAALAVGPTPIQPSSSAPSTNVAQLVASVRSKAQALENSAGMRLSFRSFTTAYKIPPESVSYADYVVVRLLYEATRDAGLWNLHWTITNKEPNSDNIWHQWRTARAPSFLMPTASAECDELSALYAFLAGRAGVKGVGLFWPSSNHTVAVWVVRPAERPVVRLVVPTSQIFLDATDTLDTRKFDPWRQKTIYEYRRRDAVDSSDLPQPLANFFLSQIDKYAGASDSTLQQLRYLRESVFLRQRTPEDAAREALKHRGALRSGSAEDLAAFQNFAQDMRSERPR